MAIGDTVVIVFVVARGWIEYLDDDGKVTSRSTTTSVTQAYRRFCETESAAMTSRSAPVTRRIGDWQRNTGRPRIPAADRSGAVRPGTRRR